MGRQDHHRVEPDPDRDQPPGWAQPLEDASARDGTPSLPRRGRRLSLLHRNPASRWLRDRLTEYVQRFGRAGAAERGAAREVVEHRMPTGPAWLSELFGPSNGRIIRRQDVLSRFPT